MRPEVKPAKSHGAQSKALWTGVWSLQWHSTSRQTKQDPTVFRDRLAEGGPGKDSGISDESRPPFSDFR